MQHSRLWFLVLISLGDMTAWFQVLFPLLVIQLYAGLEFCKTMVSQSKFMLVGQDMFENFAPNETAL